MTSNIQVVDLFCGIGGLSHGFLKEGFKVVAGFDNDPTCKFAYETNNKAVFHCKDIKESSGEGDARFGNFGKASHR